MESEDSMSTTRLFLLFMPVLWLLACDEPSCPEGTMPSGGACVPVEPDASSDVGEADGCSPRDFFRDADEDGHGDPAAMLSACEEPEGYVASNDDCDDTCPSCHPGGTEQCDGRDQDCDEAIDEDLSEIISYADVDGDTYGDEATAMTSCAMGEGRVARSGDCNDENPAVHPDATEVCNDIDDDCDEGTDEGLLLTYFRDADGDSFGTASMTMQACTPPSGYVARDGDCNDACRTCFPGGSEVCDELDNDCDTAADEGIQTTFYADCDGDGYAASAAGSYQGCGPRPTPPTGCPQGTWVVRNPNSTGNRDCLDSNALVYPGNTSYYDTPASGLALPFDYNCSGTQEREETRTGGNCESCTARVGWTDGTTPGCGVEANFLSGCRNICLMQCVCFSQQGARRQRCR